QGVFRLLVSDEHAWLVVLQAAGQELQADDRFADSGRSLDHVDMVRQQAPGAVVDEVDAADDAIGRIHCGLLRRRPDFDYRLCERQWNIRIRSHFSRSVHEVSPISSPVVNERRKQQVGQSTQALAAAASIDRSCNRRSSASAQIAPTHAIAMSFCVSHTSPCVPRKASEAVPVSSATAHSRSSYNALMAAAMANTMTFSHPSRR